MCASSLVTASFASLILGLITSFVIVISRMTNINPDNVATPIAGSLGDITSICLLSLSSQYLYDLENVTFVCIGIIAVFCLVLPIMICLARSNKYTSDVLSNGWTPIIMAMIISSVGGMILDHMVTSYKGIAIFQPLINGVGGNLVSIQASRMSTVLHQIAQLGVLPLGTEIFISPIKMFLSKEQFALTARSLMMLVVPGHVVFLFCIYIFNEMQTISVIFLVLYLFAAIFQVAILLYLSYILTNWFWKLKSDPDNNTIPYLTALGDVLGIALLGLTFYINEMLELYVY
uniref:SLC41A/MgtE integral membrane domain-containing protein n=1 Tax=Clastoptera arizonana TaxID=38151 RepID=A0A1B6DPD5_9HEMI